MVVKDVDEGSYRIDVVRRDGGKGQAKARLVVEAKGKKKSFDVVLDGRRATIAEVNVEEFWKRKR